MLSIVMATRSSAGVLRQILVRINQTLPKLSTATVESNLLDMFVFANREYVLPPIGTIFVVLKTT